MTWPMKLWLTWVPKHFHFRVSLNAISASARGDEEGALQNIERFALWLKDNRQALSKYTTALFRAGKYEQAKITLLQLYPEWTDEDSITQSDINADNYRTMVLYAAILSRLDRA